MYELTEVVVKYLKNCTHLATKEQTELHDLSQSTYLFFDSKTPQRKRNGGECLPLEFEFESDIQQTTLHILSALFIGRLPFRSLCDFTPSNLS